MKRKHIRSGLVVAVLIGLTPVVVLTADQPSSKLIAFKGKVVPLAKLVEKAGSKLDADASPHWLALVTSDGKVYPLIKDAGARMFFKDKALLERDMQLTGRLIPGSHLLRVASVRSVHKGELYEVYYWCDICSIKRGEKNICECCGGKMELREDPVK